MTSPTTTEPLLDHIVILIPHSYLTSPPPWFADAFTFYPGGRHADGLTENTLALLPDGSYLEFIAFVPDTDPERRKAHKWGGKKEGTVIDWALTLPQSDDGEGLEGQTRAFRPIQDAVRKTDTGIRYEDPIPGGRERLDGQKLRWAVSPAARTKGDTTEAIESGQLPFWCLDDTPRDLRVPYQDAQHSKHPTGVVGVAVVSITPDSKTDAASVEKVYNAVLGGDELETDSLWDLKTIAGDSLHASSQVQLEAQAEAAHVSISLYTSLDALAGKKLGGRVSDEVTLEFELVAAS